MPPFWWYEQPKGLTLFWTRVGTIASIVGWVCLLVAVIGVPLWAAIYHLAH